jgi:elongation factor Tu
MVDDEEMIELVEEEIRELLTKQGFDGAILQLSEVQVLKLLKQLTLMIHGLRKFLELAKCS